MAADSVANVIGSKDQARLIAGGRREFSLAYFNSFVRASGNIRERCRDSHGEMITRIRLICKKGLVHKSAPAWAD